jgi:hypothetical protein
MEYSLNINSSIKVSHGAAETLVKKVLVDLYKDIDKSDEDLRKAFITVLRFFMNYDEFFDWCKTGE